MTTNTKLFKVEFLGRTTMIGEAFSLVFCPEVEGGRLSLKEKPALRWKDSDDCLMTLGGDAAGFMKKLASIVSSRFGLNPAMMNGEPAFTVVLAGTDFENLTTVQGILDEAAALLRTWIDEGNVEPFKLSAFTDLKIWADYGDHEAVYEKAMKYLRDVFGTPAGYAESRWESYVELVAANAFGVTDRTGNLVTQFDCRMNFPLYRADLSILADRLTADTLERFKSILGRLSVVQGMGERPLKVPPERTSFLPDTLYRMMQCRYLVNAMPDFNRFAELSMFDIMRAAEDFGLLGAKEGPLEFIRALLSEPRRIRSRVQMIRLYQTRIDEARTLFRLTESFGLYDRNCVPL